MSIKISAIIISRNEGSQLEKCINSIQNCTDEVIVIDSSDDTSAEIISNNLGCRYYHKKISNRDIKGFADLRNFGNTISNNEWCLHIDVDEIFPESLLKNIDLIFKNIKEKDKNKEYHAYSFPRINLPFYELYPDYQTRLINKMNTEWIGKIHEKVNIFTKPYEAKHLDDYPIIHKPKNKQNKLQINKRWNNLSTEKHILICSLFRDSEKFINMFLSNLGKLIIYSNKKNIKIDLCFIEGNSTDNTHSILKSWLENTLLKNINYNFKKIDINSSLDRFTSLSILRNMLIKIGLKSYHDYILMIDSDTLPEENLLEQLIESIEINQCDVMAPLVFIENFRTYNDNYMYDTLAYIDNNNNRFDHHHPYNRELIKKDIVKMSSVGTCYLIKPNIYNINDFKDFSITKCYEESINKYPITYDSINEETNEPESEQICFFKKVKRKGYQIYVDKNIKLLHINLENLGLKWH